MVIVACGVTVPVAPPPVLAAGMVNDVVVTNVITHVPLTVPIECPAITTVAPVTSPWAVLVVIVVVPEFDELEILVTEPPLEALIDFTGVAGVL